MMISKKPNYIFMKDIAEETLLSIKNPVLPIKVMPILKELTSKNLIVHTFEQYAKIENIDYEEFLVSAPSKDGTLRYLPFNNSYILLYNKNVQKERKIWTIAHELGHYLGNHLLKKYDFLKKYPKYKQIPESLDIIFEQEANCFAKELLAPVSLVQYTMATFKALDFVAIYTILRSLFRLSKQASFHIATDISKCKTPHYSREIILKYKPALICFFDIIHDSNTFNALTKKYQLEIDLMNRQDRRVNRISEIFYDV